jgi:AraC-like DNA-binding protein
VPGLPTPDPLKRYPIFRTSDSEEFRNAILSRFGATGAEVKSPVGFVARGSLVQLQDIALVHGASSTGVSIDYPETERFRLMTALSGRGEARIGRETTEINANRSCIVSAGRASLVTGAGSHGWLTLRIDASAVDRKLATLLGSPKGRVEFAAGADRDHPQVQGLWQLVRFFAEQLSSTSVQFSPLVLRELEQTITVAFLCAFQHTYTHLLNQDVKDAAPWQVRHVEEYIEAHWNEAITIEGLVDEAGVSARALYRAFGRSRGYSPMAFAKSIRLRHARQMLAAPDADPSVTGVAFACGFANLGHFAKAYQDAFGELPSATLNRASRSQRSSKA